jgi:hypothetical protein
VYIVPARSQNARIEGFFIDPAQYWFQSEYGFRELRQVKPEQQLSRRKLMSTRILDICTIAFMFNG